MPSASAPIDWPCTLHSPLAARATDHLSCAINVARSYGVATSAGSLRPDDNREVRHVGWHRERGRLSRGRDNQRNGRWTGHAGAMDAGVCKTRFSSGEVIVTMVN